MVGWKAWINLIQAVAEWIDPGDGAVAELVADPRNMFGSKVPGKRMRWFCLAMDIGGTLIITEKENKKRKKGKSAERK